MKDNEIDLFGDIIRFFRQKRGYSLRKFAKQLGKSAAFVSKIENGQVSGSEKTIRQLAKILNLEPETLIYASGKVPKKDIVNYQIKVYWENNLNDDQSKST